MIKGQRKSSMRKNLFAELTLWQAVKYQQHFSLTTKEGKNDVF